MSVEKTDINLALRYALKSVVLCPSSSNSAYVAYLDAKKGWYEKAIQFADLALQRSPKDPKTLTYAAIAYGKAGKFSKATTTLGKALHLHPKDPFARHTLAEIYIMQREIKKAEIELLKNIHKNPTYSKSYYFLGKLYMDEIYDLRSAYECCCKYVILDLNNSCGFLDDAQKRIKELETLISQSEDENTEVLRKGSGIHW